jgi:hypothetical protein
VQHAVRTQLSRRLDSTHGFLAGLPLLCDTLRYLVAASSLY